MPVCFDFFPGMRNRNFIRLKTGKEDVSNDNIRECWLVSQPAAQNPRRSADRTGWVVAARRAGQDEQPPSRLIGYGMAHGDNGTLTPDIADER